MKQLARWFWPFYFLFFMTFYYILAARRAYDLLHHNDRGWTVEFLFFDIFMVLVFAIGLTVLLINKKESTK